MKMNICHICSNFDNFFIDFMKEQQLKNINFRVFCFRAKDKPFTKMDAPNLDVRFNFRNWQRYVFLLKERLVLKDFIDLYDHNEFDLYHAHTLFTNGYLAYKMNQLTNKPYIVAVRDTDLNIFFKKRIYLRTIGIRILRNASQIVFMSKNYLEELLEKYIPKKYHEELRRKSAIIPNGINSFYHENSLLQDKKLSLNDTLTITTVGFVSKRKNQLNVAKAVKMLNDNGYKFKYVVIGKTLESTIEQELKKYSFVERINHLNKEELIKKYRQSQIFVMPSITETFGLTYIEAMTQGLPVIYARKQGLDGYFNNGTVGYSVDPESISDIANSIIKIFNDYNFFERNAYDKAKYFKWGTIINEYYSIYTSILEGR